MIPSQKPGDCGETAMLWDRRYRSNAGSIERSGRVDAIRHRIVAALALVLALMRGIVSEIPHFWTCPEGNMTSTPPGNSGRNCVSYDMKSAGYIDQLIPS